MISDTAPPSTAEPVVAAPLTTKALSEVGAATATPADSGADTPSSSNGALAPLFQPQQAQDFRTTWDTVQIGFVDNPQQAVRQADELVAQVMKTLAETFANERSRLESQVDSSDQASTENLRVALRRYRSFFQRLLSI